MIRSLRLIDTGLRSARWNIAMTAAMSELHRTGRIPDTLRFYVYPRSVLIGRHQSLARAANVAYCRQAQIELARRVTGGGAVYMSPGVLAWDLVATRAEIGKTPAEAGGRICNAIAAGLSRLGIAAAFRAPNEIEVAGRKIAGASGFFDGPTLTHQGAILLDVNWTEMTNALVLPVARPAAVRQRLVSIAEMLGRLPEEEELGGVLTAGIADALAREIHAVTLTDDELGLVHEILEDEVGTESFVQGFDEAPAADQAVGLESAPSGPVEAHVRMYPGAERRIDQIWLTGNFSVTPTRTIPDLEAALRGLPLLAASDRAAALLHDESIALHGATRFDIAAAIASAAGSRPEKGSRGRARSRRP